MTFLADTNIIKSKENDPGKIFETKNIIGKMTSYSTVKVL